MPAKKSRVVFRGGKVRPALFRDGVNAALAGRLANKLSRKKFLEKEITRLENVGLMVPETEGTAHQVMDRVLLEYERELENIIGMAPKTQEAKQETSALDRRELLKREIPVLVHIITELPPLDSKPREVIGRILTAHREELKVASAQEARQGKLKAAWRFTNNPRAAARLARRKVSRKRGHER